jgi:putative ABC transport system permease protein
MPFSDWNELNPFNIAGQPDPGAGRRPTLEWQAVSPNYSKTLKIPLLEGRDFDSQDQHQDQSVVIIDEAIAQRYFVHIDPIGKELEDLGPQPGEENHRYKIVGVARKTLHGPPDSQQAAYQAYFPYSKPRFGTLFVRSRGDPAAIIPTVKEIVASIDPSVAQANASTFENRIARKFATRRIARRA